MSTLTSIPFTPFSSRRICPCPGKAAGEPWGKDARDAAPGRGTRRARGRGLARRHPVAPPRDWPQQQGPPLPRPPLAAAAAPASAQRTRSPRCRCRTCHHVAAAGSCLTLSGLRFPISRCPPSPAAACSAAPRGRPPPPDPVLAPRVKPPRRLLRQGGAGMLLSVQLRQRCPRCALPQGMGLNAGGAGRAVLLETGKA